MHLYKSPYRYDIFLEYSYNNYFIVFLYYSEVIKAIKRLNIYSIICLSSYQADWRVCSNKLPPTWCYYYSGLSF